MLKVRALGAGPFANVSFSVGPCETVALLAPDGAGKTDLMDAVAGARELSSGEVAIGGVDLSSSPLEAKRRLFYLTEKSPLFDDMTVRANLKFSCDLMGLTHTESIARIDRAAKEAGVEAYVDAPVTSLSKGVVRRAAFAHAFLRESELLLLDEPTAGLEPGDALAVRALIASLKGKRAVLFATKSVTEAVRLADRVLVADKGRILLDCAPDALVDRQYETDEMRARVLADESAVRAANLPSLTRAEAVKDGADAYFACPKANRAGLFAALAASKLPVAAFEPVKADLNDLLITLESDPFPGEADHESDA